MKTLRILFALFTTVIILTACTSDFSTNEGGESSITRITPTKTYSLSDVTKKEIKENKETIIITEAIDVSQDEVSDMPGVIIKFIKSADKTMTPAQLYASDSPLWALNYDPDMVKQMLNHLRNYPKSEEIFNIVLEEVNNGIIAINKFGATL